MTFREQALVVRRGWMWVVVGAVVVAALGAFMASREPASYVSTTRMYVASAVEFDKPDQRYSQYRVSPERVASLVQLLNSQITSDAVEATSEDGLDGLQGVVVSSPPGTVVVDVQVTAASAADAERIAVGYGEVAPEVIRDVEGESAPIDVTVIDPPAAGVSLSRGPVPNAVVGAALGAVVSAGLLIFLSWVRRTRATR